MDTSSETPRDRADVLTDAVRVLTEAARLRRPVMQPDEDGQWRAHPTRTEPADWAEFVTQALAGAAANVGSVHAALAGRPGSREADKIGDLLHSTVGYDEQYLFEHRTEPLHVTVDVEQILTDLDIVWLYDDAEAALDQLYGDATAEFDYSPYYWTYTRNDSGEFAADDPTAPPWSIEAWRTAAAEQMPADALAWWEQALTTGDTLHASIVKSPEAASAADELAAQEDAISMDYRARVEALAAQRVREWATYAEAFAANVRREAARVYPGVPVQIDLRTGPTVVTTDIDELDFYGSPEARLIEFATGHTPLPGSGLAPKDHPHDTSIHAAETAAGRLPHLRLPDNTHRRAQAAEGEQHDRG